MPLLLIILGLLAPRVVLCIAWCAGIFNGVWATFLWPLLGFIFLPFTTLAYGLAHAYGSGTQGVWLLIVILAVALDLGIIGGSAKNRRRQRRPAE